MLDSLLGRARVRSIRNYLAATLLLTAAALSPAPVRAQGAAPDYSGWQALLDQYVVRMGGKGAPADTRFDYEQLYVDEGIWTKHESARLNAIHARLFAVPPSQMDDRTRRAWALNVCNFLVIERATLHLLVPGRLFLRYDNVDQIVTADGTFFDARTVEVEGRMLSIAEFERRYVYGDSTPSNEPRVRAGDPRLAFAICRTWLGGPPLAARAFRPESLEVQLDQAARTALATPRMVQYDRATRSLLVSNYIGLRAIDFAAGPGGLMGFLEKFGPGPLRTAIRREKFTEVTRYTTIDPALNQFLRPKPKPPAEPAGTKS